MAIVYGASSGLHEAPVTHYGLEVSFGYYAAIYHLLRGRCSSIVGTHRGYQLQSGTVRLSSPWGCWRWVRCDVSLAFAAAVVTCVLFGFQSVFLDLGTSGHPQVPGIALTPARSMLLTYVTDIELRPGRRLLAGVAAFRRSDGGALTMRGDFVLAFP